MCVSIFVLQSETQRYFSFGACVSISVLQSETQRYFSPYAPQNIPKKTPIELQMDPKITDRAAARVGCVSVVDHLSTRRGLI